ncbi:MAG: hypothetical protein AB7I04_11150 [Pseudomonadales bacterium]
MNRISKRLVLPTAVLLASGCQWPFPSSPPEQVVSQGMLETLQDTGLYAQVTPVAPIGRHYIPAEGAWRILGCFRFVAPRGEEGTSCVDSFRAYELDTGNWVVALDLNGIHRWRAISLRNETPASAGGGRPLPGEKPPSENGAAAGAIERDGP